MTDLQCTWGIIRTDCFEFVSPDNCTLPELLEEVKGLVLAWDDPAEEAPPLQLCRTTPEDRRIWELQQERIQMSRTVLKGPSNG